MANYLTSNLLKFYAKIICFLWLHFYIITFQPENEYYVIHCFSTFKAFINITPLLTLGELITRGLSNIIQTWYVCIVCNFLPAKITSLYVLYPVILAGNRNIGPATKLWVCNITPSVKAASSIRPVGSEPNAYSPCAPRGTPFSMNISKPWLQSSSANLVNLTTF